MEWSFHLNLSPPPPPPLTVITQFYHHPPSITTIDNRPPTFYPPPTEDYTRQRNTFAPTHHCFSSRSSSSTSPRPRSSVYFHTQSYFRTHHGYHRDLHPPPPSGRSVPYAHLPLPKFLSRPLLPLSLPIRIRVPSAPVFPCSSVLHAPPRSDGHQLCIVHCAYITYRIYHIRN